MTYDAIIFDLDGTLLDTERPALLSAQEALASLGHQVPMEFLVTFVGVDEDTVTQRLNARLGIDLDFATYDAAFTAAHEKRRHSQLRPGVATLLAALSYPLAIATSSRRARAQEKIAATGLAPHFRTVVTADCVTRRKPDPEPFLLAAARLQAAPKRCLAFEDSDTGVAAALAAGMTVVHVPDMLVPDASPAHHFTPDLLEGARMAGLNV